MTYCWYYSYCQEYPYGQGDQGECFPKNKKGWTAFGHTDCTSGDYKGTYGKSYGVVYEYGDTY